MISLSSTIVVSKQQVSCVLSGEAVILHLESGNYFGLNPVGARVWDLLQQPVRVSELREVILNEFEVASERCEADLLGLLKDLSDHGLIEAS